MFHTNKLVLPYKSLAGALLFCVFLGPVGLLYSSTMGGIFMLIIGILIFSTKLPAPIVVVWIVSCVWAVAATNRYNKKILKEFKIGVSREAKLTLPDGDS